MTESMSNRYFNEFIVINDRVRPLVTAIGEAKLCIAYGKRKLCLPPINRVPQARMCAVLVLLAFANTARNAKAVQHQSQ